MMCVQLLRFSCERKSFGSCISPTFAFKLHSQKLLTAKNFVIAVGGRPRYPDVSLRIGITFTAREIQFSE